LDGALLLLLLLPLLVLADGFEGAVWIMTEVMVDCWCGDCAESGTFEFTVSVAAVAEVGRMDGVL